MNGTSRRFWPLIALCILAAIAGACVTRPADVDDLCSIYDQKGGFFNNWYKQSLRVEREFGVPPQVLMATIWKESSFRPRVKPARKKFLGFIPGPRPSDSYGYSQALDSTWRQYREETGRHRAKRNRFRDAVHFVGWYHDKSHRLNGVSKDDAYNLYLNYYLGHGGFARGLAAGDAFAREAARRVEAQAERYRRQLDRCRG